jgi:hypothetical protein
MITTKMALAIAVTSVMVAVAVAPMLLSTSALAARETTCTNGGGHEKTCGSPPAKCEVVKAGEGQGSGEIKSDTCA